MIMSGPWCCGASVNQVKLFNQVSASAPPGLFGSSKAEHTWLVSLLLPGSQNALCTTFVCVCVCVCVCACVYHLLSESSILLLQHLPPGTDIICFPISPPPRAVLRISTFSVSFASPASAGPQEMATHSSILAWRLPWTEEPGGLQWLSSSLCNLRHTSRIRAYFLFWKMRKVLKMFQETLDIILLP